jgi:hypothetical protein
MSPEPTPQPAPEQAATRYVDEQLQKARASIKRTRIVSIVLVVIVFTYLSVIVHLLKKEYLQPKAAAEMANMQLVSFVQQSGPQLTKELKSEIPKLIAEIPDLMLAQLPLLREAVEARVEDALTAYCEQTATEMGGALDQFLLENREDIRALIEAGQDPAAVEELGEHLEDEIRSYLKMTGPDGESIQQKLDIALAQLSKLDARLHRLAYGKDLTAQEKKLRHAIALITRAGQAEAAQGILVVE